RSSRRPAGGTGVADPGCPAPDMAAPLRADGGPVSRARGRRHVPCAVQGPPRIAPGCRRDRIALRYRGALPPQTRHPVDRLHGTRRRTRRAPPAAPAHAGAYDHGDGPRSHVYGRYPPGVVDKDVAPGEHWVDAAYIDAELLVRSQEDHGITLRGPTPPNPTWQAKIAGAYTVTDFSVDWVHQQVQCPQGKTSASWTYRTDHP